MGCDRSAGIRLRALRLFDPDGATEVAIEIKGKRLHLYRDLNKNEVAETIAFDQNRLADGITIKITNSTGTAIYTITSISRYQMDDPITRDSLLIHARVQDGEIQYEQYGDVELRGSHKKPAIAHFHGPLTVSLQTINWEIPETRLKKGDKPTDIRVAVGTLDANRGCWTVVKTHNGNASAFPENVFPYVEIEFPPMTVGEPPLKRRFALNEFC